MNIYKAHINICHKWHGIKFKTHLKTVVTMLWERAAAADHTVSDQTSCHRRESFQSSLVWWQTVQRSEQQEVVPRRSHVERCTPGNTDCLSRQHHSATYSHTQTTECVGVILKCDACQKHKHVKGTLRRRLSHGYFSFIAKYTSNWLMSHRSHP